MLYVRYWDILVFSEVNSLTFLPISFVNLTHARIHSLHEHSALPLSILIRMFLMIKATEGIRKRKAIK